MLILSFDAVPFAGVVRILVMKLEYEPYDRICSSDDIRIEIIDTKTVIVTQIVYPFTYKFIVKKNEHNFLVYQSLAESRTNWI